MRAAGVPNYKDFLFDRLHWFPFQLLQGVIAGGFKQDPSMFGTGTAGLLRFLLATHYINSFTKALISSGHESIVVQSADTSPNSPHSSPIW